MIIMCVDDVIGRMAEPDPPRSAQYFIGRKQCLPQRQASRTAPPIPFPRHLLDDDLSTSTLRRPRRTTILFRDGSGAAARDSGRSHPV